MIKQKLPGIYVQPSYKSALSKDPLFEVHALFMFTITTCGYSWILLRKLEPAQNNLHAISAQALPKKKKKEDISNFKLSVVCAVFKPVLLGVDILNYLVSHCFLVWFGVIFIRHGLYQDGVFKFTVYIPDNYPDGECPVSILHFI